MAQSLERIAASLEILTKPGAAGVVGWTIPVKVARIHPDAALPYKAHPTDAGYDLAVCESLSIGPGADALMRTGLKIEIPEGWYGVIFPRSSTNLLVEGGVLDPGYRGEILLRLQNRGEAFIDINVNDRIAQIVFRDIVEAEWEEVAEADLTPSDRGDGGFGSTNDQPA